MKKIALTLSLSLSPLLAGDLFSSKMMSSELAMDIAQKAVEQRLVFAGEE